MIRKVFLAGVFMIALPAVSAMGHEEQTPIILDVDMALDDLRAMSLALNSPRVEIKAIVVSDGSSSIHTGYRNLLRILKFMEATQIPVGMGKDLGQPAPRWRSHSEAMGWADVPEVPVPDSIPDATSVIVRALQETERKVVYVCLSPLTNLAEAMRRNPTVKHQIESILYYGTPPWLFKPGWNTERDMVSAQEVFSAGIPLYAFEGRPTKLFGFDMSLYREIQTHQTRGGRLIDLLHRDWRIQKLLNEEHLGGWDETAILYLHNPAVGVFRPVEGSHPVFVISEWDQETARTTYLEILTMSEGHIDPRMPVVLKRYPTNPSQFKDDVRSVIPEIITRYGLEEWESLLLTNELHRHLGIYSILGAKMGIHARELLNASLDSLRVESRAGLQPPVSCLNDGLQVATGASLGRGTIQLIDGDPEPAATFIKGNKRLNLRIKDKILHQIEADLRSVVHLHGSTSDAYWRELRDLAIRYWLEMDRREIFEERIP